MLAYEILVDKFNKKYKKLDESQKDLLKHYISNISNTNSLRDYVDNEVTKIKKQLNVDLPKVSDKITKIKLAEAINQVENLTVNLSLTTTIANASARENLLDVKSLTSLNTSFNLVPFFIAL